MHRFLFKFYAIFLITSWFYWSFAFDLKIVYLDWGQYVGNVDHSFLRDAYTPRQRLDFGVNLALWPILTWENNLLSYIDKSQYRSISWHYRFSGEILNRVLFIYFEHQSTHLLDSDFNRLNENLIGIKWKLYEK